VVFEHDLETLDWQEIATILAERSLSNLTEFIN